MSLIAAYYGRERKNYNDAFGTFGTPTPQEIEMMRQQVKAVEQAFGDRKSTRDLILAQMGFKQAVGPDGKKSIIPLTREERLAVMSAADKSRSSALGAYNERASAAATGTTKLPSFLKKDIDHQKVKEEALLEELLGPEALQSTAGKQAVEALRKKEEEIRQRMQDQDLATAPGAAMGLGTQMQGTKANQIGMLEALPNQQQGLISARGSLLQQMQNYRLGELQKRLGELESKRQGITSILTLGGTVGGAAASYANQNMGQRGDNMMSTAGSTGVNGIENYGGPSYAANIPSLYGYGVAQ